MPDHCAVRRCEVLPDPLGQICLVLNGDPDRRLRLHTEDDVGATGEVLNRPIGLPIGEAEDVLGDLELVLWICPEIEARLPLRSQQPNLGRDGPRRLPAALGAYRDE